MQKGERTRTHILERSAALFNRYGYAATSLSDVMAATGLEKGGIYNHFANKEELMLEAFEFAMRAVDERYRAALHGRRDALARLAAVLEVYESMVLNPPVRGGCPILNAATEADDAMPALRDRVRRAMNGWFTAIKGIMERGKLERQIRADADAAEVASTLFAMLEGAVMLSQLYRDPSHISRAVRFLQGYLQTLEPTVESV